MKFGCAITREPQTSRAGRTLVENVLCRFDGPCDVATVFFTPHHIEGILDVLDVIHDRLAPRCLLGCSCEGVIGADEEVERQPGISLLAGVMPGVQLQPFHLDPGDWKPLTRDPSKLRVLARPQDDTRAWIVLGDPYTTPVTDMLELLENASPGTPVLGGMSSGGGPGQNVLVLNDRLYTAGLVGLTISGDVRVDSVVSQGARPIGRPLVVTSAEGNEIQQLAGRTALETTREILESLSPEEEEQLEDGLFLGIVLNEYLAEFGPGDFIIRNVVGYDAESESLIIGDEVKTGQTVQFHVRDAGAADEDLRLLMKRQGRGTAPAGGLIFSCNGRGQRLFDRPCHDIMAVLDAVPTTPLAGFFAAGEIGPIGAKSFIHGQTASVALFRERSQE